MTIFFRWSDPDSPDLANWKQKRLTYTYGGRASSKAFWVFELGGQYRPGLSITNHRLLVGIDFGDMGEGVVKNPENWIDFEAPAFKGETKHPRQVIVKSNERGSCGIGADIRGFLTVTAIRLANTKELARALRLNELEVSPQKW